MSLERLVKARYSRYQNAAPKGGQSMLRRLGITPKKEGREPRFVNYPRRIAIGVSAAALAALILVPTVGVLSAMLSFDAHAKNVPLYLSRAEAEQIKKDNFRSLNAIEYPKQGFKLEPIEKDYVDAMNDFAFRLSEGIDLRQGTVFSPLASYIGLDIFSYAGDENAMATYESVIGNKEMRQRNYLHMLRTNSFYEEDQAMSQIYNGFFFHSDYEPNPSYLDFLTSRKVEAFSADFRTALPQIADWANQRVGQQGMIKPSDFKLSDYSKALELTLMHFKSRWRSMYKKENTSDLVFHGISNDRRVPFMNHTVASRPVFDKAQIEPRHGAYEYEGYFSAYDHYLYGYSVQYLVPKSLDDSIFDLLDGVNFLEEDPDRYCYLIDKSATDPKEQDYAYGGIRFIVPRFEMNRTVDLNDAYKSMGLGSLYADRTDNHVLINAFTDSDINGSRLEDARQISCIQFNEDGTEARTIAIHVGAGNTAAYVLGSGLEIRLDQPFVYVIRDPNGLPIYIGSVTQL